MLAMDGAQKGLRLGGLGRALADARRRASAAAVLAGGARALVLAVIGLLAVLPAIAQASDGTFDRAWGKDVGGPGVAVCTVSANCQAGTQGGLGGEFNGPGLIATDAAGNVYVTDTSYERVQKFDSSGAFLLAWGKDVGGPGVAVCTASANCQAGTQGGLGGEFSPNGPDGVATDAAGDVYVTEFYGNRVQKFDPSGTFLLAWGKDVGGPGVDTCTVAASCQAGAAGGAGGDFSGPEGVATDSAGNVYVADSGNSRVQKFDSSGSFLRAWGKNVGGAGVSVCAVAASCRAATRGGEGDAFSDPFGVGVDAAGDFYVTDANEFRVQKFDSSGGFLRAWGKDVGGPGVDLCTVPANCQVGSQGDTQGGHFAANGPAGVAIDGADVYVVNAASGGRIQEFDASGAFVRAWGKDVGGAGVPICTVAADCQVGTAGGHGGEFAFPAGVATDSGGDVYVADGNNRRIQKFSASTPMRTLTVSTSGSGAQSSNGARAVVTGPGIDCSTGDQFQHNHCTTTVTGGTQITLTATPAQGGGPFTGFTGGRCGATSPCTVTMNADQSVDARFAGPPSATVTTPPDGGTYRSGTVVNASYSCSPSPDGGALKSGAAGCSGPVPNGSPIDTTAAGAHAFTVTATDADGQSATTTSHYTVTLSPIGGIPVNVKTPFVSFSPSSNSFVCDPGTWQNLPGNQAFAYAWLRRPSGSNASVVARTRTFKPGALAAHSAFGCQVTVPGFTGSTIATPVFTPLSPTVVPISAYGNFRIRGIDVFQVVQPNSCAVMFSFPSGAFPCFSGGGTPSSYGPSGKLAPGADPQRTKYVGVQIDADRRTTAVVYLDRTDGVANPGVHLEVTLTALYHGRRIGVALTRGITKPLPFGSTPWVTASERGDPAYGVQFQLPASWLQVPTRGVGGTIDLMAKVGFPAGTPHLLAVECNPSQLTVKNLTVLVNRDCSGDNSFRLDHVPALHLLALNVRSFELLGNNQNLGSIKPPDQVLSSARQLYPGGERMSVWPYANWIGVVNQETLTASLASTILPGETAPVYLCNGLRYVSTAATPTTPAIALTPPTVTRACRWSAIQAVVTQWEAQNPLSGFDVTMAVHNYTIPLASGPVTEPGWTPLGATLATVQSRSDALQPLFLVNDGSAGRPKGAAAHEFGHVMGLPHASTACGGGTGGQSGEAWLPDQIGRLQGVEFSPASGFQIVDTATNPLIDLMSYCGPGASPTSTTGSSVESSLWISPRNWNHAFSTLRAYAALPAAADRPSPTRAAGAASSGQAFVVGVADAGGARILRVVQPHGHDAIPATAPGSALRLRALDSAGRVLVDEGVQVQQSLDAPGAATFLAPVPVRAAAVELTSHGAVLDRKQRNRSPRVRLLAPGRRARAHAGGSLLVRWSATDPEGDQLQATIDYSFDGGRSWRTIYDGPSTGRASVPGRFLEGSHRARIRVYVNDGFNEASAVSPIFRADGTAPVAQIVRPAAGEPVRASEQTLLIGSAFDDRHRSLHGRALTWYAGRHRLGSGEQLEATLPSGRIVLRLVTRDRDGHQTVLRRVLHVIPAPLQLLQLSSPNVVRHRARTIAVRVAASTTATLRTGGQRYRVGRRPRTIVIRLPRHPATGLLTLPIELAAATPGTPNRTRSEIVVVRL
jgi:hypothetical protein